MRLLINPKSNPAFHVVVSSHFKSGLNPLGREIGDLFIRTKLIVSTVLSGKIGRHIRIITLLKILLTGNTVS